MPSRRKLTTTVLNRIYENLRHAMVSSLRGQSVCMTSDGWTNIKGRAVVNYMVAHRGLILFLVPVSFKMLGQAFFIEAVATGAQGHTAEFIANDLSRVITECNYMDTVGVVTDNTSANKSAWKILAERFKDKFFYGCACHTLHLLARDLFDQNEGALAGLTEFVGGLSEIVNCFSKSHLLNSQLTSLQEERRLRAIVRPCPTRWCSIKKCCESLLESEALLLQLVSSRDFAKGKSRSQNIQRTKVRNIIADAKFVPNLRKVVLILQPIDSLITKYQSDTVPLSDIFRDFKELVVKYEEAGLTRNEKDFILENVQSRARFLMSGVHNLAYLLDPRYYGTELSTAEQNEAEAIIRDLSPGKEDLAYAELASFLCQCADEEKSQSFR